MNTLIHNLITATFHGSIIIMAVILLRIILNQASKKTICLLWTLAFVRLLLPVEIPSPISLQPVLPFSEIQWNPWTARLLILVWLLIAVAFAIYSAISYLKLKQKVQNAKKIPGGWECDSIDTAFVLGFISPKIYIPTHTPESVRQYILDHERTHLEKGDLWFKMLGFIAVALHWFNPLAWLAYLLYSKDLEMACDERVVQFMELDERKSYSTALLNCASEEPHLGICPVAFGEVSVKDRILFVLQYKQPTFWISLLGVIAIAFVAGCLVTSSDNKFSAVDMTKEELVGKCNSEINTLRNAESFYLHGKYLQDFGMGTIEYQTDFRRHGSDYAHVPTNNILGSMAFEGTSISFSGDAWVVDTIQISPDEIESNANYVLTSCILENKMINYADSIGAIDEHTASFSVSWDDNRYNGIFSYHFDDKGSLRSITQDYIDSEGNFKHTNTLTVMDESPNDTYAHIKALSEEAVTADELNILRREAEIVTEVPSNKTDYDKNYFLGSGSKQWNFFKSQSNYHVRLSTDNCSPTGLTLVHNEASNDHTSLVAEEGYWLEKLVENQWIIVPSLVETVDHPAQIINVNWTSSDSYTLDWESIYGQLDSGFYRIGRYYTMTDASGTSETQVCYAKFRIYPPNFDQLLDKCNHAMVQLFTSNGPAIHFQTTDWCKQIREAPEYRELHGKEHYIITELWRNGSDCLEETQYILKSDKSLKSHHGLLYRNNNYYDLTWENANAENTVTSWNSNTYADKMNFELALANYTLWDGLIQGIREDGNTITVEMSQDWELLGFQYPAHSEVVFTFDESEKLTGIKKFTVYGKYADDYELEAELVVYNTSADQITAIIQQQNINSPNRFSWEEDSAKLSESGLNIRTKNFVNDTQSTITSPTDAIEIAMKDCTLPASAGMEPGTNMSKAFYDESAKMWKVEFTASWDDRIYQAVYLNEFGITQLTVQSTN